MFEEKTVEEFEAMSAKEQADYLLAKKKHEAEIRQKEISDAIEKLKSETSAESKAQIEKLEAENKSLTEKIEEMALRFKAFTEKPMSMEKFEQKVVKAIADKADDIKRIAKDGFGMIEIYSAKAVDTIATTSATNPDGIPEIAGVQMAPPNNVNLRAALIQSLVTTIPTNMAAYPYTEALPKDGDVGFVLEKGSKPQVDLKFETRYAEPVKAAGYERLTTESVQDIPNLQSIARDFLRKKHDLKKEDGILNGDGIAPNPKGATEYGRTFVPGGMANKLQVVNFMDVVNACITDIYTTHNFQDEMPYMANIVLMNPIDFFIELVSAKTTEGIPLYPTASLFNRVTIGGVTIIPHEDIESGKIFVADLSKYNTTDYIGYSVRIGWVNDDFIKNQFVMVGESRFHAFVKKLDEAAFIFDDIATIKAALQAT